MNKLKELINRAILVAAWRDGDVDTEDGTYATTDTDEMIHLESAIQDFFDGMEAYDLICTGRLGDYIDIVLDNELGQVNHHDRLTEENAKLREALEQSSEVLRRQLSQYYYKDEVAMLNQYESNKKILNQLKDQNNDK